jgi:hypothetical protein
MFNVQCSMFNVQCSMFNVQKNKIQSNPYCSSLKIFKTCFSILIFGIYLEFGAWVLLFRFFLSYHRF